VTRTEQEILEEALDSLELVASYVAREDRTKQLVLDAISMRIIAGVEALNKLDPQRREELFGDGWTHMRAMRNRIAHGYEFVDPEVVLETATRDVPRVLETINAVLKP